MSAFACMDDLVRAIHDKTASSGQRFSFGVTGGGSTALSLLMAQPGASTTVLEFTCTYATESTLDFVGRNTDIPPQIKSFASAETADSLARAALARSVHLLTYQASDMCQLACLQGACGVGATAALASKTWKRGDHRLFVSLAGCDRNVSVSVTLHKGSEMAPFRSRQQEDDLCGRVIVGVVACACGVLGDGDSLLHFLLRNGLHPQDSFSWSSAAPKAALQALLDSSASNVLCIPIARDRLLYVPDVPANSLGKHCDTPPRIVVLPGSFNPLHAGHEAALRSCIELCDAALKPCPLYELSVFNVDKPPVPLADLEHRLSHFSRQNVCVLLTKTPRFMDKARAYPGMSYVIGVDTLVRLVDPVYTDGSSHLMESSLAAMVATGSEFFVLPRLYGSVKIPAKFGFQLKDDELLTYSMAVRLHIVPEALRASFKEVADNAYSDVSSSAIRKLQPSATDA